MNYILAKKLRAAERGWVVYNNCLPWFPGRWQQCFCWISNQFVKHLIKYKEVKTKCKMLQNLTGLFFKNLHLHIQETKKNSIASLIPSWSASLIKHPWYKQDTWQASVSDSYSLSSAVGMHYSLFLLRHVHTFLSPCPTQPDSCTNFLSCSLRAIKNKTQHMKIK